jgi:hypothetical protein
MERIAMATMTSSMPEEEVTQEEDPTSKTTTVARIAMATMTSYMPEEEVTQEEDPTAKTTPRSK